MAAGPRRSGDWRAGAEFKRRCQELTAQRLPPTDSQRIQRALEVYYVTGTPISALQGKRATEPLGDTIAVALVPADRAALHDAIARRFDAMLAAGLVDELRRLREIHAVDPAMPSMRCVGYRQAWQFLEGEIDADGLRAAGIAATFYATHCQNDSPLFLAAWYVLATLGVAAVGAIIGTRVLRW